MPHDREKGPGVKPERWPKYRYCFLALRKREVCLQQVLRWPLFRDGRQDPRNIERQDPQKRVCNPVQRTPWGVGKKRGEENLTKDTRPKTGVLGPFAQYVFHPPQVSVLCFPTSKSTTEQTRSSFKGVQELSGECVLWCVFLPPYVLHPPIARPQKSDSEVRCHL